MEYLGNRVQINLKYINMKIFVFGSTGMLGTYISTFLSSKYDIVNVSRADIDASESNSSLISNFLMTKGIKKEDIIVNAIGTIKPRVDELGDLNAILVNSVFPHYLANSADELNVKMIHITTDCVFTGNKGSYSEPTYMTYLMFMEDQNQWASLQVLQLYELQL